MAALCALGCLISVDARGQEPRVAVVVGVDASPMGDRLTSELRGVGLEPVLLVRAQRDQDEAVDLDVLRRQSDTLAAFEVVPGQHLMRMCLPVPGSHEPLKRELSWSEGDPMAESMVAVQAVELLRAGLLEVNEDRLRGKRASRLTLLELATLGGPRDRRWSAALGTRVTAGGWLRAQTEIDLAGRVAVWGPILATARVGLPVSRAVYEDPSGTVHLAQGSVEVGAALRLVPPDAPWRPDVGVHGGLGVIGLGYTPALLFTVDDEGGRFARGRAGVGAGLGTPRLGPLGGRADVSIDASSKVNVAFDGQSSGSWGPLGVGFGAAVDVLF